MSELEKAKQIAAEAFNFKSKAYTTIEQQNEIIEVNRKAFMQILSLSSLTISKSITDELKDAIGATNFESTPYSVNLDEDGYLKMWASLRHKKLSDKTYKFCRDNTRVFDAYLNPLTRDLVKVV